MPSNFNDITVNGRVTQTQAAVNADHCMRKGEVDTALAGKASTADARFTDARAPIGSVPGGSDVEGTWQGGPTLKAIVAAEGTGATKVTYDAKGRITGKLTPGASDVVAHAANHKSGGSDAVRLDELAVPTASVALNAQKLTGVQDPAAAQDAATKAYVDARRLDQVAAPTASVALNAQKLTGVLDPTAAQDGATKAYVDARRLDQAAAPTGSVALNAQKLTGVLDPTAAQDAATKAYVDAAVQGLGNKAACRIATTANHALSGLAAIDGVTPTGGDRVLVKDQTTGSQNGIYVAAAGAWARATDADISAEVVAGLYVFVQEGTVNGDSGWVLTTNNPITLGSTSLTFVQFSGAGQITAGAGIVKSGNQLSADFAATATAGKVCEANDARLSNARQMAAATADVDANTHKVVNVVDPTAAQDAATKAYVDARRLDQAAAPTASVALNAQKLTGVLDPTAAQDAATKAYVDARRLDQAAAPTASVALNAQKLTGVLDPTAAQDAATKAYVDAAFQGLGNKTACRVASTGNLALSGLGAIDGVTPVGGDRVLAKDQTTGSQNGIYVAAAGAWARATDADISAEVVAGLYVFVAEGTVNGDSGWVLTTNNPITLGTTALTFVQFSGAGQITAGAGIVKSGNQLSADFAATATAGKVCEANDARLSNARQMAAATGSVDFNSQKGINVANPTAAQDAATKTYVDNGSRTGALVWVDAVYGSDGTGTRARADLPFLTLGAAKTAAASGDTIIVLPGTYNENNLLKNGVNWHFLPGAKVTYTSTGAAAIFDDSSSGANADVVCSITGYGVFTNSGTSSTARVTRLGRAATSIYMECVKIEASGSSIISALFIEGATLNLECDEILCTAGNGIEMNLGTLHARVRSITAHGGSAGAVAIVQGTVNLFVFDMIKATGSGAAGLWIQGGTVDVTAREVLATSGYALELTYDGNPSFVTINQARLVSQLATASGKAVYIADALIELTLRDVVLVANTLGTPAIVSIDAAAATNVRLYGYGMANIAKAGAITFIVGSTRFEVDADVR